MTEKVILPKDVADSILNFRDEDHDNQYIISCLMEGDAGRNIHDFVNHNENGFDIFVAALINGFEIEKTPDEQLYDYFVGLMEAEANLENKGKSGSQFRQGWQSVDETLRILGITVKGINDM